MMRFEFAVAADLAANVLSVCLVVFLTLLPLAGERAAPPRGSDWAAAMPEAGDRFLLAERRPLSGEAMLRLLHARRADPDLAVVDLFADRIELRRGAGEATIVSPARIGELARGRVALFVIDPAFYAPVRGRLGPEVAEMSIPDALRDREAPRQRFDPAFRRLDAAPRPLPEFQAGLLRILEAGSGDAAAAARGSASGGAGPSLGTRLFEDLRIVLRLGVPAVAAFALARSEVRRRRRRFTG